MKKHLHLLALLVAFLLPWVTKAQTPFTDYEFSVSNVTFSSIVSTGTAMSFSSTDDGYGTCTLPFAFDFGQSSLASGSTIACSANGFIFLGASSTSGTTASYTSTTDNSINALINQDGHMGRHTGAGAYYKYDATAGTFTIEYHLLGLYSATSSTYGQFSYQVVLHNTGTIDIIYDLVNKESTTPTFRVFLNDGTHANRCYLSGTWANPTLNIGGSATTMPTTNLPTQGLCYTFAVPTCRSVSNLAASQIDTTSFSVSWTDRANASEFAVRLTATGLDTVVYTTTASHTFTDLTPGTNYTVRVRPICSSTDTGRATQISVRTNCSYLDSLPYVVDFESSPTGSTTGTTFVDCLVRLNNGTTYFGYPYVYASAYHTGSKGSYWYASTTTGTYGDYQVVSLPGLGPNIDLDTLQLRFWAKATSATYHPVFIVGVMDDPYDITSFTALQTVNISNSTQWEEAVVSLAGYTGTGRFVAIRANRPTSAWYAYVDDISLERVDDCPRVENLAVSNIAITSATVNWTEMGNATSYTVVYRPTNDTVADTVVVYAPFIQLDSLQAGTAYTVEITPICTGISRPNQIGFTTECSYLTTLPYTMGFETADGVTTTGGSSSFNWMPCWHRLNNGTSYFGYPYIASSTTYAHSGSRGLYWYNATTTGTYGDYQVVVLRGVDTSVYQMNTLQLKFWAKASSTSYSPVFHVGVMTDPEDASTFQEIATVNVGNSAEWDEYSVAFTSFTGSGNYVALRANRPTSSWYAYVDDFTLEQAPQCPALTHLTVEAVSTTSATMTWDYPTDLLGTPQGFEVEYYAQGDTANALTTTLTSPRLFLTGLDTNTTYVVRLRANCDSYGYGAWDSITFTTNGLLCVQMDPTSLDTVNFSNGTSTYSGTLVYSSYGNTMYQVIYTAAELQAAGLSAGHIIGMDFGFGANSSYAKEFTILVGTTNSSSFTSYSACVDPSTLQQVYGPTAYPMYTSAGWRHFDFTTPFVWNGTSNIIVCTFMNQPSGSSHGSSGFSGYYTSGPSNTSIYRYKDSNPFTFANYTTYSSGSMNANRASIHFYTAECAQVASCAAPTVYVTRVASDEIDIEWAAGFQETSWDVEYRVAGTSGWQLASSSESNTSYTFTNLTPNTDYEIRVSHYCEGSTYATTVNVTTPCVPIVSLPWNEDFESSSVGSTTSRGFVNCMGRLNNGTTYFGYPYVNSGTTYNHTTGGTKGLYWYLTTTTGTYGDYEVVVLPAIDTDVYAINTLQLKFWAMSTGTSYHPVFIVGVMSDSSDVSTFVPVDTVYTDNIAWEDFIVRFDNFTGSGNYIAIRANRPTSSWYAVIDDITIEELDDCPRVDSLMVTSVEAHSAEFSWVETGSATEWVVRYYPTATPSLVDSVTAYSIPYTLTGLNMQTSYTVEVYPECYGGNTQSRVCTFTTPCESITTFPYTENFDSYTSSTTSATGVYVPCWDRIMTGTSSYQTGSYLPQIYYSSSYAHSGNYSYRLYGVGYHMLPPMGASLDSLQLSFWDYTTSTSYGLEVGVMEGTTFVPIQTIPTTSSTHVEYLVNFASYTGTSRIIAFRNYYTSSASTYYSYHYIDNITVDYRPVCPRVESLTATNITGNSANLTWTDTAHASSYWVYYYPTASPALIDSDYVYTTSCALTGLRSMTNYTVIVMPDCNGEIAGRNEISFSTACGYIDLPFTYGFEDMATTSSSSHPNIPCWHHLNNATSYPGYPYITSTAHTGSRGLYWYGSTTTGTYGDYYYIVLPAVDTFTSPMNTLRVRFWAKASSTSYHPIVRVGVMTDPANVNTFQAVNSNIAINPGSSTNWAEFTVDLTNYTGAGEYIAIGAVRPTSSWYMYMDDITVLQIPDCDGVTNIALTGVTTTSATLNWTDNANATSWELEYGPSGFVRGNGTTVTVTTLPYTLTGLNVGTPYDVYIAPACTGLPEVVRYTFNTECTPISTLPYTMGFETSDGVNSTGSSTSVVWMDCWHHLNNGTQYFGYPYVASSTTYAHTGSRGLYWYSTSTTGTYGDYEYAILPGIDTFALSISNMMLSFWEKNSSSTTATFQVGVMTNPLDHSSFQQIAQIACTNTDWDRKDVSFENFTGHGGYIAIRAMRSGSWTAYIDDISLVPLPDCRRVTNITANNYTTSSVTLNWTENGTATSWTLIYGPTGFNPNAGTGVTEAAYSLPHTISGLTANTAYDVYIVPTCSGVADTNMFSFRTECAAMTTLPYTMGFENADGVTATSTTTTRPYIPCWHHINNGTQYFGYPYVTTTAHTGSRSLYWYATTTTGTYGDYEIVVLPAIDTDIYAINTLQLKFWAKSSSTSYHPYFEVGVMSNPYDNNTFQLVQTIDVGTNTNWEEYVTAFSNYTGNGQYVAVRAVRPASSWYAYTDDFTLELAPLCPPVVNVSIDEVGTTGALVTWGVQPGIAGTPVSYEISVTSDSIGATPHTFTSTQPRILLSGLAPATGYSVVIRANCDVDGYGAWSTPVTFNTGDYPCVAVDPNNSINVTIGTGTTTNSYIPSYSTYNYGLSQQIYRASEINGSGNITSISVMPSAISQQRTFEVYLAHTTQTTLSGFIHPSDMVCVYNGGPITLTANQWVTFNFTTPFAYNGTDNLLVCFRDMTGSWVSGNSWLGHTPPSSATSVYVYQDGSAYDPYTTTGGTTVAFRNNLKIYGEVCLAHGTCAPPLVVVDSVSENEITVSWAAGGDESSWDVEYRQGTTGTWTYENNESNQTYTFTNLTANTTYQIRITANCTDTDMATILTVKTPCAAVTVPYTQNFEDAATGTSAAFPPCMYRLNNGTSYGYYPYVSSSTSYNHTPGGSKGLYWYNTTTTGTYGDYQIVILPRVDVSTNPINTLQLTFWAKPSSTSYSPVFQVGVMSDPEDVSTFQMVSTVNLTSSTDWQPFEVALANYNGTGEYIALRANRPSSSWYAYVDDLSIEHAPACARIRNVVARNITQNAATIAWTASDAGEYEVEYGPVGFAHGAGTIVSSIYDDSVALAGLTTNTAYDVYVRGICTSDTGNWSFVYQFRTSCGVIDSLPFVEDFETQATGGSSTGTAFVPCWTRINNGTSYGGYPYVSSSTSYNHTMGGTKGLYWYGSTTSGTYGDYQYVILPEIDTMVLPINTIQLSFWVRSSSTSYNPVFEVGVMADNTDTAFESLQTIHVNGNTEWAEHIVDLNGHTGAGSYVAIRALRPTSSWYAYVDDIKLDLIPRCPRVENLHATMATLDSITVVWNDTSSTNTSWVVEYDTADFTPGTGAVTPNYATDTFFIMTGLDSGTTYHVYVYPSCDGDVYWRHITATTLASSPTTVPYFCGFGDDEGQAWDLVNGSEINRWAIGNATHVGTADSSALYISTDNGATHTYNSNAASFTYAYRTFRLDSGEYGLSFDWHCLGEGEEDDYAYDFLRPFIAPAGLQLNAGVAPDGHTTDSYTFAESALPTGCIELSDYSYVYAWVNQSAWSHYSGTFNISESGVYRLVFAWGNDETSGDNPPAAIDNVTLQQNICPSITNLAVSNILCDSATITWGASSEHTDFFVEYDTVPFVPGSGAFSVSVNDSSALLTGLDTGMTYYVYVRPICNGDTGMAVGTRFTTLAGLPATVPYFCNFEGPGVNGWELINGTQTNYWMVGNNVGNTGKSLYITNDGSTNNYTISSDANVFAIRALNLTDTGEYAYSFDWKANGESCCDYMRAALMPATFNPTAGDAAGFAQATGTPVTGALADLSNSTRMNVVTTWQNQTGTFRISTPGIYKMVFFWHNDGSVGTMPPAAVDNVSLQRNSCPMVQNVSAATFADSINITWTAGGSESEWELTLGNTTVTVYSTDYTFTGLTPNTNYAFAIRAICGAGDTSMYYSETYHTPCSNVSLPYTQNFDALSSGTMPSCWQYVLTNSSYSSSTYYPGAYSSSTYAHSGSYSLRLYGVGYHMLPPMAAPLDSLQLTFWNYTTSNYYGLEVGVMEGNNFVPVQNVSLPSSSTHVQTTVYFGTYTGNSRIIAFRNFYTTSTTTGYSYNYIDDVVVDYIPVCPPVVGITSTGASSTSITVDWTDQGSPSAWEIEYGRAGYTFGSTAGTRVLVTSHPAVITGLDTLTAYDFYVRPICSSTDTGDWSTAATLWSAMCENAQIASTATPTSTNGTTYYYPVNNYYRYTLSETIIDSAELNGPMDIQTIAYYYDHTAAVTDKPNCTVYFQPTARSTFSSSSDIVAVDTATAVRVYVGDFNFSQGWNYLTLDTVYHYSGIGNLLVIVDDNSNDYNSSGYNYRTKSCTGNKTIVYYSDSYDPDAFTVTSSYSGTKAVYTARVDMQLISCGAAGCRAPAITSTTTTYQSGTVNWAGNGFAYEVSYKTTDAANWSADIPVTTNSYTFTGLQPATVYMFRVRQDCTADSLGYSNWVMGSFVTDSIGCVHPDSLTLLSATNATATFGWTVVGNETAWDIRIFNTSGDTTYTVTTNPATVSGLTAGVTYYAAIRALCGSAHNIPGFWSDSIQFTTQTCPTVTGVTSSNVTFNSVTLNWPAATLAQSYEVDYGMTGFTQGNGTRVTTTTNSITVTGLMDETSYEFYVRAVCGTDWLSESWSTPVTVTTGSITGTTYTVTLTVNNSQWGRVTGDGLYAENAQVTISAIANTGYHFVQWSDNDTHAVRTFTITNDVTLQATFAPNQYTVTVTSTDPTMGSATVSGTGVFNYGATATLTATPATGHHFLQWNDNDTHMVRTITVTCDTTFTASFAPNQYTVTGSPNDATMGTVTGSGPYNYGTTATLTATPNSGFYFHRWNDGNVDNPRSFVVTGNVSYTAIFSNDSNQTQTYTVTLNVNDPAMGQVHGAGTYAEGSEVEISATPNTGYRFVTWSDNVTTNPRMLTVNSDITLTATFATAVDSSALLVVTYDPTMGQIVINGRETDTYNGRLGDEVRLRAEAFEGYQFVDWSDGVDTPERTITLRQNRTEIGANFSDGNGILTVNGNVSCLIYPNPATSSTTISVSGANGKVRIAVVDINGRVAASETMECAGDCVKTMNVDNLSQGAYFVRITGEKINLVKKLIVR